MNDARYTRKFTRVELLTYTYNLVLQRVVDFTLDVEFYEKQAAKFKKRSNEYNEFMQKSLDAQTFLNNNELSLSVIEKQLAKYEKQESKNE